MSSARAHEAGFTLIELLTAMVAASLLLFALAGVTSFLGQRYRQLRVADAEAPIDRQSAFAALVGGALPAQVPTDLIVSPQTLRFRLNRAALTSEAPLVELAIDPSAKTLVAQIVDPVSGLAMPGTTETLVDHASGMTLNAEVITATNNDRRLGMVEFGFVDARGQPHSWVATPVVAARPGCIIDPLSQTCRP